MSITDELREYVSHYSVAGSTKDKLLTAIADRIDAEYQKAIRELNNLADDSVLLPVDADGEYVHIGDVMEDADGEVFTVSSIDYGFHMSPNREVACWMLWSIDAEFDEPADQCRHHHEPTVEDVLREFGDWYAHTKGGCDEDGIVAEYAAKLRLVGDSE